MSSRKKYIIDIIAVGIATILMVLLNLAYNKPSQHVLEKSQQIAMQQTEQIEILELHNDERKRTGRKVLFAWSTDLEKEATAWSERLAAENNFYHSKVQNVGENLFEGTADVYTNAEMINAWIKEKADFQAGIFPNVARDNNIAHVGHYTQIIWDYQAKDNPKVGCGKGSNAQWDYLTCKYEPPGNVIGAKVSPIK